MIEVIDDDGLRHLDLTVEFSGDEDYHSTEVFCTTVTIVPSPVENNYGSSKVKLKNIVDFSWEPHFYTGQLLAVHMSGKYLAYGIKAGSGAGVVRVVYKDSEQRALLRGMRGTIQDLAFAHVSNVILACIDYTGSFFVHTIVSTTTQLVCNLLLFINSEDVSPCSHRVIWCPYLPDEDASDGGEDVSKLLMVTRDSTAELWSVDNVWTQFGSGPLSLNDSNVKSCGGFMEICKHESTIVEAILSPDGTAIATASLDGEVNFFQINFYGSTLQEARCLRKWKPHDGRPVSSLFFLDDHKNYNPDAQFWRFAITGCDNNTELKVWSCKQWKCLQTIHFKSPPNGKTPVFKAGLDLSAGFLLLSDICNKGLYILSLVKDPNDEKACISTISEFRLPYPILSFGIVDAGIRKIRPTSESLEDLCPCEDESEDHLVIRMYLVQPKSLQECHIAFKPVRIVPSTCKMDTLTHDSLDYIEDLLLLQREQNNMAEENGETTVAAAIESATNHNTGINLMTPDAFSSPTKKENNLSESTSPELGDLLSASPSLAQVVHALNSSDAPLATSEQAPQSGGSSPSREVREILSLAEPEEDEKDEDSKTLEINNKKDENWSNIPMAFLSTVHVDSDELSNDSQRPKNEALKQRKTWLATENAVNSLATKLDGLLQIIGEQRQDLKELRSEVSKLRQENSVLSRVESPFGGITQQQLTAIEQSIYNKLARQSGFMTEIEVAVKETVQSTLPKIVKDVIDPLKIQAKTDMKRIDDLLNENLTQLVGGNQMRDIVTLAVVNAAKPVLDSAFKEAFANDLLPGIEKACETMFRQIQEVFVRGSKDYLQNIENFLDEACQKKNEQLTENLSRLVREELQNEMARGLNSLQDGIVKTVKESIRDNFGQNFIDIQARSRATTPGISIPSPVDAQARVLTLLHKGQYNTAFQQALSASDLGLVVLVCEKIEPAKVFASSSGSQGSGSRCILQQPVILSLVQQLSADLTHRTELKHKWLEEAIWSLDPTDPVTREHMGAVLITLQTQLSSFINSNPNHRLTRRMKMLSMAARSLLYQHP
ncbi:enhancer of mRNA-decapping protein 4 [Chelonus insularis]|uniref:enhancer of mRNA-decapping protein 4 n=1 Tax=Chelonus insularis TaxID=460826 RepID=UPI00158DC784|nr:enhancer of mRNA-decapping protein 4 [Chelonus insularis]